jgi:hypothetical protein
MGMSGQYGRTFASKLIQDGKLEEAVTAATEAIASEADNPEHFADRATASAQLNRNEEAADDFARALALDAEAQVLETDLIDDAYFSSLLEAARAEAPRSLDAACARLAGYRVVLPSGRHLRDADEWTRRLKGELRTEYVKVREE